MNLTTTRDDRPFLGVLIDGPHRDVLVRLRCGTTPEFPPSVVEIFQHGKVSAYVETEHDRATKLSVYRFYDTIKDSNSKA